MQALEVIAAMPKVLQAEVITAGKNAELLIQQARQFQPNAVVIGEESLYEQVRDALADLPVKVYAGSKALEQVVAMDTVDMVLTALVGYAGLLPTVAAIKAGKPIALANKETLVVAGSLITELARAHAVNIYPVDSEHSAIFQCLAGEFENPIEKLILTASGGPFRGKKAAELAQVSRQQALKHPNWTMGAKITIDSATLMNKGLEVIEAKWLFAVPAKDIEVVVHPQSIIHSLVQFRDGSMKAQLGLPDMKLPIQYALSYPQRQPNTFPRFSFTQYPNLTFEQPDMESFRCLQLAFDVLAKGGTAPCVLYAANEIAVAAFLEDRIGFLDIPALIEQTLAKTEFVANPGLEDFVNTDTEARRIATSLLSASVRSS